MNAAATAERPTASVDPRKYVAAWYPDIRRGRDLSRTAEYTPRADLDPEVDCLVDFLKAPPGLDPEPVEEHLFHLAASEAGLGPKLHRAAEGCAGPDSGAERALPLITHLSLRLRHNGTVYTRTGSDWDPRAPKGRGATEPDSLEIGAYRVEPGADPPATAAEAARRPDRFLWIPAGWAMMDPGRADWPMDMMVMGPAKEPTAVIEDIVDILAETCYTEQPFDDQDRDAAAKHFRDEHRAWLRYKTMPEAEALRLNVLDILEDRISGSPLLTPSGAQRQLVVTVARAPDEIVRIGVAVKRETP